MKSSSLAALSLLLVAGLVQAASPQATPSGVRRTSLWATSQGPNPANLDLPLGSAQAGQAPPSAAPAAQVPLPMPSPVAPPQVNPGAAPSSVTPPAQGVPQAPVIQAGCCGGCGSCAPKVPLCQQLCAWITYHPVTCGACKQGCTGCRQPHLYLYFFCPPCVQGGPPHYCPSCATCAGNLRGGCATCGSQP